MKTMTMHWRSMTVVALLLMCGGAVAWRSAAVAVLMPQEPAGYAPLTEMDRDAVRNLLDRLDLDRDAMIALNPTAAQAESILSTVRTWRATNAATLASLKATIDQKRPAVRTIERAVRMGPADPARPAALALARQELKNALDGYTAALAPLETSISNLLSSAQRTTWTAIKGGHGQQMPIRMLSLSGDQRLAVSKAQRRTRRLRAGASDAAARTTAISDGATAMNAILTTDQQSAVASYRTNYNVASAAVAGAFDTVLAVSAG